MKNKTLKSNLITYGLVIIVFLIVQGLLSADKLSSLIEGLLIPLCVYVILAISLNLVVGISGELSLGHAGFMCVGAFASAFFSKCTMDIIPESHIRFIDKVSFVPKSNFVGAATVQYTGWSTNGKSFTGTVTIDVYDSAQQIRYTLRSGGVADFNAVEFDRLCEYYTGDPLRYVRFTLPSSSRGTLYYDYNSSSGSYGSKVSSYTNYYYSSSPYLDRISFVANESFSGSLEISFTGWSTGGKSSRSLSMPIC